MILLEFIGNSKKNYEKIKLLILLYFFLIGLNSCGTVKEAFSTQKKTAQTNF